MLSITNNLIRNKSFVYTQLNYQTLLFQTTHFSISQQRLMIPSITITNNLIKHQSFAYTQLNDQAVLFQVIQFSICHLFLYILNVKQALPLWGRVDLGVMAMMGYSTFPKALAWL